MVSFHQLICKYLYMWLVKLHKIRATVLPFQTQVRQTGVAAVQQLRHVHEILM